MSHISFSRFLATARDEPFKKKDTRTRHDINDTRKSHHKNDTRTHHGVTQFDHAHFICWDGEGITDPYKTNIDTDAEKVDYQVYALLMNNEGVERVNIRGLSTVECLDTIINATDDKLAIHVCFGASYDTNMILHGVSMDIPESKLRELHKGKSIDYNKYQLTYRPHKSLEIREYMTVHQKYRLNSKTGKREGWYKKSVTLWDVFGFFQTSFVETLSKYFTRGNHVTSEEKEKYTEIIGKIKEGKQRRGTFTEQELHTFVKPYCKLEVDALLELMVKLHGYLREADIRIARWDGAGAIAAALLKKYEVKEHIDEKYIPQEVIEASEYAFFGGRIEVLQYGNYEDETYHEDISSAYPAEMEELYSLKNAEWSHGTALSPYGIRHAPKISLFLISWKMKSDTIIAPFPWRDKDGNVYFPPQGKAWVWKPELEMVLDCFKGKYKCRIFVHEYWTCKPVIDHMPYGFIRKLYKLRQEYIKQGSGVEKVIKLGINSFYGKTAQSVGYRDGKKPPYHNLVVAGMTTSGTRAKMLRAAMQSPESIIMLATDGIYSTKHLDVPTSPEKKLGEWESSVHKYITIVASGVYWYKSESEDENAFSRGFDKYSILRDNIIREWNNGTNELYCDTTRFVGLGSAIGLNDFSKWCTWRTVKRALGLNMSKVKKRREMHNPNNPSQGLVRTYAASFRGMDMLGENLHFPYNGNGDVMMSHKYKFIWDGANEFDSFDGVRMRTYLDEVANTMS